MEKLLEDVVAEINAEEEEKVQQPFIVEDKESAAEAQRRITYFNDQMAEIDSIIENQIQPFLDKIERIKSWGEEAKQEYIDKVEHYSLMLESYIREEVSNQIAKGKKPKKTIKLPYGKIALKKQQPQFDRDEETLFEYAKSAGFTKVKESTDWSNLKKKCQVKEGKLITEDGEVVPGVTVVERDDKFELKMD